MYTSCKEWTIFFFFWESTQRRVAIFYRFLHNIIFVQRRKLKNLFSEWKYYVIIIYKARRSKNWSCTTDVFVKSVENENYFILVALTDTRKICVVLFYTSNMQIRLAHDRTIIYASIYDKYCGVHFIMLTLTSAALYLCIIVIILWYSFMRTY